jgi:hypothetical protein
VAGHRQRDILPERAGDDLDAHGHAVGGGAGRTTTTGQPQRLNGSV